jgi:hypothetical protein
MEEACRRRNMEILWWLGLFIAFLSHPPEQIAMRAGSFDVDPVGGTTGAGFLIGNATAPTS